MNDVRSIINEWDPIDLFPFCPLDEYDSEILQIKAIFKDTMKEDELGEHINSIFTKSFGKSLFQKSNNECCLIARKILEDRV